MCGVGDRAGDFRVFQEAYQLIWLGYSPGAQTGVEAVGLHKEREDCKFWTGNRLLFQEKRRLWTHSFNSVGRKGKWDRTGTQYALTAELMLSALINYC